MAILHNTYMIPYYNHNSNIDGVHGIYMVYMVYIVILYTLILLPCNSCYFFWIFIRLISIMVYWVDVRADWITGHEVSPYLGPSLTHLPHCIPSIENLMPPPCRLYTCIELEVDGCVLIECGYQMDVAQSLI